ncbi:MAG: type II/IV secretion system ATPase subunit [Acidilobaceae archaeon]|nr:type II/IV secretion system ATPase subunit [Acidilobaceae archaeon]MCX8165670.1 type II/IV secretion system ATPase subunit [Acidilobaceae archaeon]MDW7974095.1 type II/IV secretion system ATPase subunit [Sulfolobales archaeon]
MISLFKEVLATQRKEEEKVEEIQRPPDDWRVSARYQVGPVTYYLYSDDMGLSRLKFVEPQLKSSRLKEILAGLAKPEGEAEQYHVNKAASGYGPLYPLIIDPNVEEIAVEGPNRSVAVIHRLVPARWVDVDLVLDSQTTDSLAVQLARKAGRLISIASPYAEGLTSEGFRVSVTFMKEISRFGSSFVLRKYPEKPATMGDMIAGRNLSPLMAAYLWIMVEAQLFTMVIGSMGAGKTTLLQALAGLIAPYNRVVTIEDTPELRLLTPHWDSLITRPSIPGESLTEVDLEALLKLSLRRRAEYIIVGEVRGREARILAQAAALGHGVMTTFHADSPEGAVMRLQMEPISLPELFLRLLAVIVHVRKVPTYGGKARRRVSTIAEVNEDEIVKVFSWNPVDDSFAPSRAEEVLKVSARLEEAWIRLGIPHRELARELENRAEVLEKLAGLPPEEFQKAIARFYMSSYGEVIGV